MFVLQNRNLELIDGTCEEASPVAVLLNSLVYEGFSLKCLEVPVEDCLTKC